MDRSLVPPGMSVEAMLAEIASLDSTAATLAYEVLRRRRSTPGADVDGWIEQIAAGRASLLSSFTKTRLASIARQELGIPPPPEELR